MRGIGSTEHKKYLRKNKNKNPNILMLENMAATTNLAAITPKIITS